MDYLKICYLLFILKLCTKECSSSKKIKDIKILGGQIADWKKYKFMAYVFFQRTESVYSSCGGTLVTPQWVLTAAHCLPWRNTKLFVILGQGRLGSLKEYLPKALHTDLKIKHDQYQRHPRRMYDIALVRLKKKIILSENITLVKLSNRNIPPGTHCTSLGWGIIHFVKISLSDIPGQIKMVNMTRDPDNNLREVQVEIGSYMKCEKDVSWLTPESKIDEFIWIKKSLTSKYVMGPSIEDSGGPLICKGEQVGIFSTFLRGLDHPCARMTRVGAFLTWISNIINKYKKYKIVSPLGALLRVGDGSLRVYVSITLILFSFLFHCVFYE